MEARLREKQLREKEEEERQRRIAAKLKEKVHVVQGTSQSHVVRSLKMSKKKKMFKILNRIVGVGKG